MIEYKSDIDFQEVAEWFELLYRDADGYLHVANTGNWAGRFFRIKDGFVPPALYVEQLGRTHTPGIYARITTVVAPPKRREDRGGALITTSMPALWADVDIAGPNHRHMECFGGAACQHDTFHPNQILPLPPNEEVVREIVHESHLPIPSAWVHSGGGMYPIWMVNPVPNVSRDLLQAQRLASDWQQVMGAAAKHLGYHYGTGVGDLARLLRVPGTWNRKTTIPQRCHVIQFGRDGYPLEDLIQAVAYARGMFPEPAPPPARQVAPRTEGDDRRPGDDFAERVDWGHELLLGRLGWKVVVRRGNYREWLRPDATSTSTLSGTTGRHDGDNLYVFSTETPFPTDVPITKLEAFRIIHGHATHRDAVRALGQLGFGAPPQGRYTVDAGPLDWPAGATRTRP